MRWCVVLLFLIVADTKAADLTPSEVLASVRVMGNGMTCSGTIIAVGPAGGSAYGCSAAHCQAKPGTTFRIGFVDGSIGSARWLAADIGKDIALFVCWADDVIAYAPVPDALPDAAPKFVSFPAGSGPKVSALTYRDNNGTNGTANRARFDVANGEFRGGSSGGGVFRAGCLTSVVTNGHDGGPAHGCYHNDLVTFIREHASLFRECAPLVQCADGKCAKDANGRWIPSSNVAIVLPRAERQSKDIYTDKAATKHILDLEARLAKLEQRVADLEAGKSDAPPPPDPNKQPAPPPKEVAGRDGRDGERGPAGPAGPAGPIGPPGRDGKDGVVTVLVTKPDGTVDTYANLNGGTVLVNSKSVVVKNK